MFETQKKSILRKCQEVHDELVSCATPYSLLFSCEFIKNKLSRRVISIRMEGGS